MIENLIIKEIFKRRSYLAGMFFSALAMVLLFAIPSRAQKILADQGTPAVTRTAQATSSVTLENGEPLKPANSGTKKVDVTIIESELTEKQMQLIPENKTIPLPKPASRKTSQKAKNDSTSSPAVLKTNASRQAQGEAVAAALNNTEIQGRQIIQINQSLRRMIEENDRLRRERDDLDRNLRTLRGQRVLDENRVTAAVKERDKVKKEMQNIISMNERFQAEMERMKAGLTAKERWVDSRMRESGVDLSVADEATMKEISSQLPKDEQTLGILRYDLQATKDRLERLKLELAISEARATATEPAPQPEAASPTPSRKIVATSADTPTSASGAVAAQKTEEVIATLNDLSHTSEQMRADESRVHYNMGNKFFRMGDYEKASAEYSKAIELRPDDANAHFNLAFVSGEFIKDFVKAEKHYRQYLLLNPAAPDANLVKEKIVEAELILRTMLDKSLVEGHWQRKRNDIYTR